MGWELHMTRADDWSQSADRPITAEEWLAVVAADPELHIDEANGRYFAVWSHPRSKSDGGWFDWADGQVSTKQPDRPVLKKLLQLADKLGATVQGDDGEVYNHPSQLPNDAVAEADSYLRRHRIINVIGLILLALSFVWVSFKLITWVSRHA
jgi:hypothetical protein